ncbi:(2Fe-2S)-binding protein [Actinomadura sp. SCN-SB]|uniref:(2Fe-2S)-binding protein n=1 Tax=Actinomadura sp. SCN-SB TaxID=3373092 RepID=UPI0037512032
MTRVRLSVNGKEYRLDVPAARRLLDCLRHDLELTGTKEGCGTGACGACTVLVDGEMISSCLLPAVMADGREVVTIEGVSQDGEPSALQRAFVERGGFQCGICTPGQILAARALLEETPDPSPDEVTRWMAGNLCRCTGYYKIVEAVLAAAGEGRAADERA